MNDLALHFLAKMKIMVVKDVEREDIEFICKGLGCKPIASLDHFTSDMLGSAELVEEMHAGSSKIVKVRRNTYVYVIQLWLSTCKNMAVIDHFIGYLAAVLLCHLM